ncbi:MAG: glutamate 5-kinase [Anaerolineales bacterium]
MSKTIVVKVGSSTLTGGTLRLSKPNMLEIVRQVALLHQDGYRVLLVSSGAMAAGRDHLGQQRFPSSLPTKQMLSAVGQGQLMRIYSDMFALYEVKVGQVLVTVAVEEIKVGDNDNLSALIATVINADMLLLLTDRDGLYTKDPRQHEDAQHIPTVKRITAELKALAGGDSSSGLGIGGMQTKLQAAELAGQSGITTVIARGTEKDVILRIVAGEALGTYFEPTAPRLESRKRWMLSEPAQGRIVIDTGAARALRTGEASLLPVGIRAVEGEFPRGALVEIVLAEASTESPCLARGQANYDSAELRRLCGVKSNDIEAHLGYHYGDAAVHHDYMVLLHDMQE